MDTIPTAVETPKGRSVRYSLSRGDIFRWHIYMLLRNRVLIGFALIFDLFTLWIILRSPEMAGYPVGFKIFYSVLFICLMFVFAGLFTIIMMGCTVMFKKYRGFPGRTRVGDSRGRSDGADRRQRIAASLGRFPQDR
jgi:hypothetical protein